MTRKKWRNGFSVPEHLARHGAQFAGVRARNEQRMRKNAAQRQKYADKRKTMSGEEILELAATRQLRKQRLVRSLLAPSLRAHSLAGCIRRRCIK